ncbi:MAG: right-handed parallel beta-helix repeat-containing protein [Thermodesulfobacteriota bacterium]
MKTTRLIILTIILALLAVPAVLMAAAGPGATSYYVDIANGDDANNGLAAYSPLNVPPDGPWKTLHYAASTLEDTDNNIIYVAAGVYSALNGEPDDTLQFFMSNSSILGAPGGGTIIDASGDLAFWDTAVYMYACNNVLFSDFEVRNASLDGIYVEFGSGVVITRCNVHDNLSYGIVLYECDSATTVNRNRIYNNPDGIEVSSFGSIFSSSPWIVNNLIFGQSENMGRGIVVQAMGSTTNVSPTIFHNTIDRGMSYGIELNNPDLGTMSPSIQYNIITNCGTGIYGYNLSGTLDPYIDYNDLFGNGVDYNGVVSGANDLALDPLYVDPASGTNYHLTAGSPCIDAAVGSENPEDLDGTTRPQGMGIDIGCYEYYLSTPVPPVYIPGITVVPTEGLVTGEDGSGATFTVVLNSPPAADVTIPLSSSDTSEGTVSPASLTFTPTNWYTPRIVTVKGVDDSLNDGDIPYTVVLGPAVSNASDYNGLDGADVGVVNNDNDGPGFRVTPTSGLMTSRFGGSDTFTVVLTCQPAAPVNVSLSSSDTGVGIVSPQELIFTPVNWNVPQSVTVTGQDNGTAGNVPYTVITAPGVSDDPDYNGLDPDDVGVTNIDNLPASQPQYVYPLPSQRFAPGNPVALRGSAFYDPDGDSHVESYWRIGLAGRNTFGCQDYPEFFDHLSSSDLTEYSLPVDLLATGVAYQWVVAYRDAGSGVFSWSDRDEQENNVFIIGQEETVELPPIPPGNRARDFQMRSFHHYISGDASAAGVIGDDLVGGYNTRYYRIGTYDTENNGAYQEYPSFSVYPGQAAWFLARNGLTVDLTGVPVTVTEDVDVPLKFYDDTDNGWNMIGPPNDRNYRWEDVEVVVYGGGGNCDIVSGPTRIGDLGDSNPYIDLRLWEWVDGAYVEAGMMMSGYGYWVKARQKGVVLRFPASSQATLKNPGVLLAVAMDKIREEARALVSPAEALADADKDSPPRPMDVIEDEGKEGSSSGGTCFINTLE